MNRRLAIDLAIGLGLLLSGCGKPGPVAPPPAPLRDEVPPAELSAVMDAHYRGLGAMERYEYARAAQAFREAHDRAPGWVAGSINLAVALLNQGGEAAEKAKTSGRGELSAVAESNLGEARRLLDGVIARQPDNPFARFSRGIILRSQGEVEAAHLDFRKVTEAAPDDAIAWLERGMTLTEPDTGGMPAGVKQGKELVAIYSKALELNPYLVTAMFKLSEAYRFVGDRKQAAKQLKDFQALDPNKVPDASGEFEAVVYGGLGPHARVIDPFPKAKAPSKAGPAPRFGPPTAIQVKLADGDRWAAVADLPGPLARLRERFGAGVASFDADGDGRLDLYLTAAIVGSKGPRDALLRNRGDGSFDDATAAFGLPLDRAGLGVAAGDFDADGRLDLFLTGVGDSRLYRNLGKRFQDVTKQAGIAGPPAISPTARWLDLDQDGDLDLYVINHMAVDGSRLANSAYRNDGRASRVGDRPESNWAPLAVATEDLPAAEGLSIAFSTAFPGQDALAGGEAKHTGVAALDIDEDRDIDLVLTADDHPAVAILNDRAGAFHAVPLVDIKPDGPVAGLLVIDVDKDGRPDLVTVGQGTRASAWRNATTRTMGVAKLAFEPMPIGARDWRAAQAVDIDLDTWPDLVALPPFDPNFGLGWARNAGSKLDALAFPVGPDGAETRPIAGFAMADLVGDALPDLVTVRDGEVPRLCKNLGNGQHWLAVDLSGRWKFSFDQMRTNPQGVGTRLSLEGQGIHVPYDHTTPSSGPGQSVGPVVLGLGANTSAPLLRLRWPDGVMQCELNVTADKTLKLAELNRKTGSCPVLFTWNGARFECLGDFLGGGGMGYLVAPGLYGQPDRDESVAIQPAQLKPVQGVYRLSVVEPMDEVAYLDKLTLEVVDRPPGVSSTPDERFAPEGPRPTGDVLAWSKTVEPIKATDHEGRDVTAEVRAWDRRTVDRISLLKGWIGYAEPHSMILDFGPRLSEFKPEERLTLCLAGWVEYPYSQTNYAAATAGVSLKPPVLERKNDDGTWSVINPHPGYPAGLPRMMTVDLTGQVGGRSCVLRLTTNMECYWDQAFVALVDQDISVRSTLLPVARAELRDRGYLRESSPDGRLPLLYDYDKVDPAPLARMEGMLTRHGDVARLLTIDDDQVCTVGPGDEVRLEFDAKGLPELPEGWTRAYILRSIGYCKDADPFTAGSDSVGPLPWKGMPPFPFGPEGERKVDPEYFAYLRDYQTRPAGVR